MANRIVRRHFSKCSDPALGEMRGYAGLDLIVLDLEHGPNNVFSLQNLIRAAQVSGPLPVVRVRVDSPSLIGEVLDVGLFTGKRREIAASLTQ